MYKEIGQSASSIVPRLMFDYESLSREDMIRLCVGLTPKMVRWIAMNHPDNRTRILFFELTGVPIGEGTVINAHLTLYDEYKGMVTFGKRVAVATGVTIIASSWPNNSFLSRIDYVRNNLTKREPVRIEDDVWLGAQSVILPGITVGECSIVGVGAVVVGDVPAYSIVAGIPAKVIRRLARPECL